MQIVISRQQYFVGPKSARRPLPSWTDRQSFIALARLIGFNSCCLSLITAVMECCSNY